MSASPSNRNGNAPESVHLDWRLRNVGLQHRHGSFQPSWRKRVRERAKSQPESYSFRASKSLALTEFACLLYHPLFGSWFFSFLFFRSISFFFFFSTLCVQQEKKTLLGRKKFFYLLCPSLLNWLIHSLTALSVWILIFISSAKPAIRALNRKSLSLLNWTWTVRATLINPTPPPSPNTH